MSFKLIIKNGDMDYRYDKRGNYTSKMVDRVEEFETLSEALSEFLYSVNDEYETNKVSLVFKRPNGKK